MAAGFLRAPITDIIESDYWHRGRLKFPSRDYRSVLGLEPDPGARFWGDAIMKSTWSRAQREAEPVRSPEYRNRR
jgi:hypothetical protein